MTRTMLNKCGWLLCILFCKSLHAQSFKNKAALEPVTKTGFYSIEVTPELSSYVKTDFTDLRIMDENEKQVPYIINDKQQPFGTPSPLYRQLTILKNEVANSGKTTLVIENTARGEIGEMSLLIKNASVSRMAGLSGSEDGKHWYTILENITLQKSYNADSTSYMEDILFPFSSYHYFRLVIYNGRNDPLNIVLAATIEHKGAAVDIGDLKKYETNPLPAFAQTDSTDGYSYIQVRSNNSYHVSRIKLQVKGPKFFKRDVDVIVPNKPPANFTISSDTMFNFYLPVFNDRYWLIKIYNGDNPPLKITGITTAQESVKIKAWLEDGKPYHLVMNDSAAIAPQYDLQNFRDSIPANISSIKFETIEPITVKSAAANPGFFKQAWLWPVIIMVLVILALFTWRLTKEVGKKK